MSTHRKISCTCLRICHQNCCKLCNGQVVVLLSTELKKYLQYNYIKIVLLYFVRLIKYSATLYLYIFEKELVEYFIMNVPLIIVILKSKIRT